MLAYSNVSRETVAEAIIKHAVFFQDFFVSRQETELLDFLLNECNLAYLVTFHPLFGIQTHIDWIVLPREKLNQIDTNRWHDFCDRFCSPRNIKLCERQLAIQEHIYQLKRQIDIQHIPAELRSTCLSLLEDRSELDADEPLKLQVVPEINGFKVSLPLNSESSNLASTDRENIDFIANELGVERANVISAKEIRQAMDNKVNESKLEAEIAHLEATFSSLFSEAVEDNDETERKLSPEYFNSPFHLEISFDILPYSQALPNIGALNCWKMQLDPRKNGSQRLRLRKTSKPQKHNKTIVIL